jgi:uncharacterized repeat protein (TIGR03803 family)
MMKLILSIFSIALLHLSSFIDAQLPEMWGTTSWGGQFNQGCLYKMNASGSGITIVHDFEFPEGWYPQGELIQAADGKIYGACREGGDFGSCTLYYHEPGSDTCIDVHDFDGPLTGLLPGAGMVEAPNGKLYGVARNGGATNNGTLYSYDPATGTFTTLLHFNGTTNGGYPNTPPIVVNENFLYGTTYHGGNSSFGTLYKYDILNDSLTVVKHFTQGSGYHPKAGLLLGQDGKIYGTTFSGGAQYGGTLFWFDPATEGFNVLKYFDSPSGSSAGGALVQAPTGELYGTTMSGGDSLFGVLFKFSFTAPYYTVLHHFEEATGRSTTAPLTFGPDGKLYGTTPYGGTHSDGVIFSYDLAASTYEVIHEFNEAEGKYPQGGVTFFSTATALDPVAAKEEINLFPNPSVDQFEITCDRIANSFVSVSIQDVAGREMFTQSGEWRNGKFSQPVKVSELNPGLYFVNVHADGLDYVSRLLVE